MALLKLKNLGIEKKNQDNTHMLSLKNTDNRFIIFTKLHRN